MKRARRWARKAGSRPGAVVRSRLRQAEAGHRRRRGGHGCEEDEEGREREGGAWQAEAEEEDLTREVAPSDARPAWRGTWTTATRVSCVATSLAPSELLNLDVDDATAGRCCVQHL